MIPCDLALWLETLRHLRAAQLTARVRERLYRIMVLFLGSSAHRSSLARIPKGIAFVPPDRRIVDRLILHRRALRPRAWSSDSPRMITFLGDSLPLGLPPVWDEQRFPYMPRDPHLWLFHLHYHDWMWDIDGAGAPASIARVMSNWVEENRLGKPGCFRAAWSSYTISRRLPNWALLMARGDVPDGCVESLLQQFFHLASHLEFEHRGNHLLENLCALLLTGCFLSGPGIDEVIGRSKRLIRKELRDQILPDGMHHERCPSYHRHILTRLRELAILYHMRDPRFCMMLASVCRRMGRVDRAWRHPDGGLPLLGDTVLEGPRIRTSEKQPAMERLDDHVVLRDVARGDFFLFDGAPLGVDHLGAHMHADLFGFELSLEGRRIVSDGGGGHYAEGEERDASRAAASHATITVNRVPSAEPWKSFRMARRGHPLALRVSQKPNGHVVIEGRHDGFRQIGLIHWRRVVVRTSHRSYHFEETLLPLSPKSHSRKPLDVVVYLPLFPGVSPRVSGGKSCDLILEERVVARVELQCPLQGARVEVEDGQVYRDFGVAEPRRVLVMRITSLPGERIAWNICASREV